MPGKAAEENHAGVWTSPLSTHPRFKLGRSSPRRVGIEVVLLKQAYVLPLQPGFLSAEGSSDQVRARGRDQTKYLLTNKAQAAFMAG